MLSWSTLNRECVRVFDTIDFTPEISTRVRAPCHPLNDEKAVGIRARRLFSSPVTDQPHRRRDGKGEQQSVESPLRDSLDDPAS